MHVQSILRPVLLVVGLACLALIALMIVMPRSAVSGQAAQAPAPRAAAQANPYTVWRVCQERISTELKAPATAEFPSYDERAITHSAALWTVDSYVDAQNSFGAKLRTRYSCTASFNPTDATYRIEGVSVH